MRASLVVRTDRTAAWRVRTGTFASSVAWLAFCVSYWLVLVHPNFLVVWCLALLAVIIDSWRLKLVGVPWTVLRLEQVFSNGFDFGRSHGDWLGLIEVLFWNSISRVLATAALWIMSVVIWTCTLDLTIRPNQFWCFSSRLQSMLHPGSLVVDDSTAIIAKELLTI